MADNMRDPKAFNGWNSGTANYGYGHDAAGNPVKQEAGQMGKGTDAKSVAAGATYISAVRLTQAQYDALAVKDPNILYIIPGA